jgi:hypothetical protein
MPLKDSEARKQYQREYSQRKRLEAYARVKEWRSKNPDARKEHDKKYRKNHADKELARSILWKKANPEKVAKYAKKTKENNRARIISNKAAYRASRKNRTPTWLTDFDKLKMRCIYSVASMLKRENKEEWEVDHIIPLCGKNVSGLHVPNNLWFIKALENRYKNNKFEVNHE